MRPDERLGPKFLLYHDVAAAAGGDEARAQEGFRAHLGHLRHLGYRFVPMSVFIAGERLGPRDAIVTFDDGARSFLTCAMPVLRELRVPVTVFLPTDLMGRSDGSTQILSWEEAAQLAAEGVEFGAHGARHVPLDQVVSDRMRWEVEKATADMFEHGFRPTVFAYRFGGFNGAAKVAVRRAGYKAAFTELRGGFDRFEIRRRVFTGLEGALATRVVMNDRFFSVREAARKPVPRRVRDEELVVPEDRWGPQRFKLEDEGHGAVAEEVLVGADVEEPAAETGLDELGNLPEGGA